LILDVKFGCAAFMQTKADALTLAKAMVALGKQCGVNTRAILTDMNTPVGRAAGNWLEVKESVACLEGKGPDDLRALVIDCAAHLLVQTGKAKSLAAARKQAEACLNSGAPRLKWDEMLVAQGADISAFNRKLTKDSTAPIVVTVKASRSGFVSRCDARIIGEVIRDIGGGRLTKESGINYDVGVDQLAKPGERIAKDQTLCRIHAVDAKQVTMANKRIQSAFDISAKCSRQARLMVGTIG
jgi:thymidine phosphorylase